MNLIYIGVYTLLLVFIWGFFVVAKLHAYKFKNFSNHIEKVTTFLLFVLILLSLLGYIVLIFSPYGNITPENKASLFDNTTIHNNSKNSFEKLDFTKETNY